ncbi:MAG: phosphodiester glycosidase family protein [Christensenellales bacterium]
MKKRQNNDGYFLTENETPASGKRFDDNQLDKMGEEALRMSAKRETQREVKRNVQKETVRQETARKQSASFSPSLEDDDLQIAPAGSRRRRELKEDGVVQHGAARSIKQNGELEPLPVRQRLHYEDEAAYGENGQIRHRNRRSLGAEPPRQKNGAKPLASIWRLVVRDIFFFGIALCVFAYFHHVNTFERIFNLYPSPIVLPTPTPKATVKATPKITPSGSVDPNATLAPTDEPAEPATLREKFAAKFTAGDVVKTDTSYKSANISVELKKVQENGTTYFVADIYLADINYFKTAFGGGKYQGGTDSVVDIGNQNGAVIAITGDHYYGHKYGIVLRNGVLYREDPFEDVLVMQYDGTMQTYAKDEFDLDAIKTTGAYQVWSFGPMLLNNGQPMTQFTSVVQVANPRSAIGYYEPGHYCFVTVDGRQPGYSTGLTLSEMSQLFYKLECKVAYNLDGGATAAMAFGGKLANQQSGDRNVSDILYIAE